MSAPSTRPRKVFGALLGLVGMSAIAGLLVAVAVTPAVAVSGMAASSTLGFFGDLPEYLKIDALSQRSTIFAEKGGKPVVIARFYSQNRIEDTLDQISPYLQNAATSAEDASFYQHGAIDVTGTVRAAITDLTKSGDVQGGSSITQQYVKNVRVQSCEKYDINVTAKDGETAAQLQAAQAAMYQKYQDCADSYTDSNGLTGVARKLQEMKLAIGVEKQYTKKQILQGYLNISGFGGQIYGVEAAARYYFNTTAANVTIPEAATLIAILNNPANLRIDQDTVVKYDDGTKFVNTKANNWQETKDRRDYVINQMARYGKITAAEQKAALATPIQPHIVPLPSGCASAAKYDAAFYCETVVSEIQNNKAFGKTPEDRQTLLNQGGLKIYTPLNLDLQTTAQKALSTYIPAARADVDLGGTNVAMELNTGRVVEMVQNRPYGAAKSVDPTKPQDHNKTQVNYNVDYDLGGSTGFQTGSTYKLFTLLDWIEEGHSINDTINAPVTSFTYPQTDFHTSCNVAQDQQGGPTGGIDPNNTWEVNNDTVGEGGRMTIKTATALSVNTAFAQMGTQLDLCKIRQNALNLGIHLAYPYFFDAKSSKRVLGGNPSAILGVNEIAPVTMAAAYAAVANGGKFCEPIYIDKVIASDNSQMQVPQPDCSQKLDPGVAAAAVSVLQGVLVGNGTGQYANPNDGIPIMGKTGTTDGAAENWLVTSTTKVAQATWVGNLAGLYPAGCTQKQVYASAPGCTTANYTNFGNITFTGTNHDYQLGRNVKFAVAKPIIAKLDKIYGGSAFPPVDPKYTISKQTAIQDVSNKSVAQATAILKALGFTVQVNKTPENSWVPKGMVSSTSPKAGDSLSPGSIVYLNTSKGNRVKIPDVTNQSAAQATATLQGQGFHVKYSGDPNGVVTATDPKAGTAVGPGRVVTLKATQPQVQPGGSPPPPAAGGAPGTGGGVAPPPGGNG